MSHIHEALRRVEHEELFYSPEPAPLVLNSSAILSTIRGRAKLFWATFSVFFLAAALIVLILPKKFEAEMKLLVKNERQDLVVSPETNVASVHPNEISETQINSEIELLRSSDVLRKVALESGLSKPERGVVMAAGQISPVSLDKALQGLQHDISISAIKKSAIIDVTYTSKNPETAAKVLQRLADNYLLAHLKIHANPGTFAFFDQQAKAYQARLDASEVKLKEFREKNSALGMPNDNDVLTTRAMEAQTALEEVDAQISDYKQRIAQSQNAMNTISPRVVTLTRSVPQSQLVETLSQTLLQLRNRRTELVTKFNPQDRLVTEVDKQIADTAEALKQAQTEVIEEHASDANPVRQNTERDLVTSQVALSGLLARRNSLATVVGSYKQKMFGLADATVQHEALVREVKENQDNYLLYQKKREEARIAESLDKDRITNVAVIQAPVTPVQPSSPNVKLDLLLSFICALFFALTAVLLVEFLLPKPDIRWSADRAITGSVG